MDKTAQMLKDTAKIGWKKIRNEKCSKWWTPERKIVMGIKISKGVNSGVDMLKQFIQSEITKTQLEVLEMISNHQGWEESRDYYARKIGLPKKY